MSDPTDDVPAKTASGPLVMLGDSLTEGGPWTDALEGEVVNLGIGGQTTEDVAVRLQEVIDLDPRGVVLMIGTNDIGRRATVEQVVRGNEDILFRLRHELPDALLVVTSVLPRERERADWIRQVNIHLRQFAPTVKAEFLDLWPDFAEEDGELRQDFSDDRLHLNDDGYATWVERLRPLVA